MNEQQKQIALKAYMVGPARSHEDAIYAALEAVLEQQAESLTIAVNALEKLSCLGMGHLRGNSDGNMIAIKALEAIAQRTPATAPAPQSTDGDVVERARWYFQPVGHDGCGTGGFMKQETGPDASGVTYDPRAYGHVVYVTEADHLAALAEARRGMYSAAEIEHAIHYAAKEIRWSINLGPFMQHVLARLSAMDELEGK